MTFSPFADLAEEGLEVATLLRAVGHHEPVGGELFKRGALGFLARRFAGREPIEQFDHVGRDHHLRVCEGVHQEHLIALRHGHLNIKHRGLHANSIAGGRGAGFSRSIPLRLLSCGLR